MRLYLVPVYLADPDKRLGGYVPGLYEVSDKVDIGRYRKQLAMFKNTVALRSLLQERESDFVRLNLDKEIVLTQAFKQLDETDLNLEQQAKNAKFIPQQFPSIYQRKIQLNIPVKPYPFKHLSIISHKFKHSLFRIYGIRMDEIIVVTGFVLKTTDKMEEEELKYAQRIFDLLSASDFDLSTFNGYPFPIDYHDHS